MVTPGCAGRDGGAVRRDGAGRREEREREADFDGQDSRGDISDVEEETENGKTVYEAHVRKGNDVLEIEVDASGKVLKREAEGKGSEPPRR